MRIAKYNTSKGSNTYKTVVNTVVSGGGSVDTSGLEAQIAANSASISENRVNISDLQNTVNAIPGKYLKRTGDSTDSTYRFGTIYTDNLESQNYNSGRGFRLVGDSNSSAEDKYQFKMIDLGNGYINFTATASEETREVYNTSYDKMTLLKNNAFSINNSVPGASVIVSAGYNLTHRNYFTIISEKLQYQYFQSISFTANPPGSEIGGNDTLWFDAEQVGNGWEIPLTSNGRESTYNIRYIVEYSYNSPTAGGTQAQWIGYISLYIQGTDPNNNRTYFYGGSYRYTEMTSSYIQCISGTSGYKMTSNGIYKSTDGGESWTKVL